MGLFFPRTIACFGTVEPVPDAEVALGFVVCFVLTILTIFWMSVPRAFREQRPACHQVAMALCAGGMCMVLIEVVFFTYPREVVPTLAFGRGCAKALGVLMVFDLIAWGCRPSSIPRARVTHGR